MQNDNATSCQVRQSHPSGPGAKTEFLHLDSPRVGYHVFDLYFYYTTSPHGFKFVLKFQGKMKNDFRVVN